MKILIGADVSPDPNAGAAGTVVQTNEALAALGHTVEAFWAEDIGRRIRHGNLHYALELPWRYRTLVRHRLASTGYDVVQLSQPHAYLAARDHRRRGWPGVFVNRSHGVETRSDAAMARWATGHGAPMSRLRRSASAVLARALRAHWRAAARWSDGMIVPCELDRQWVLEEYPLEPWRVRTIPHGVPQEFADDDPSPLDRQRLMRLLYVAQYARFKAPETVAAIANAVLPRYPGARLTWVTPATAHPTVHALLVPDAAARVDLVDWRPQSDLRAILDAHGIFLFPSYFEGAGKTCLEALARGLVVVASDNGAMRDYIRDGIDGWVLPPGDPVPFVNVVEQSLAQVDASIHMGLRARDVGRSYTWRRCAIAALSFYRELDERRAARPSAAPNF
jgi:glycosyltransferase involved in cell wall biosynthesis